MIWYKVVLTLQIFDFIIVLPHLQEPTVHARRYSFSFEDASKGLVIGYYCESCTPWVMVKVTAGQHYRECFLIRGRTASLTGVKFLREIIMVGLSHRAGFD